ncbi:IreB family regulatory phosphoprotein [Fodinisporobacter ferrooxydans]
MNQHLDKTMKFNVRTEEVNLAQEAILTAYHALKEKGYNPIDQIVGYLISGDPAYITSHNDARNAMRRVERDDLIEELVRAYLASRV